MPVYVVSCPDCGNVARTLVLEGCRMPSEWVCSRCQGRARREEEPAARHPWEERRGAGCLCCGAENGAALGCIAIE